MNDMAFIINRTLENKIAIAENNNQNTLLVTLDVLKSILALLKGQQKTIESLREALNNVQEKTLVSGQTEVLFRDDKSTIPDWT